MESYITLGECINTLKYLIQNNKTLIDKGEKPISFGIMGSCGIGKTRSIEQLAKDLGMTLTTLVLSQLEEVGDLIGMPIKEVETNDGQGIPVDLISGCNFDSFTGKSRTSYSPPAGLPKEENPNGTILFLDDGNRCSSIFSQAIMQLIQDGEYISGSLPKYTTIILSSNPDNGEFQVVGSDPAQRSRYINFPVKFSIEEGASGAEKVELDNRCLNFALSYSSELFETSNHAINARSYTMFANAISGIENWSNPENLAMILNIARGCFDDNENAIGNLFTTFIANKLDTLVSPKEMLLGDGEIIAPKIEKAVYDENGKYRAAIASILQTRLLNYTDFYFSGPVVDTGIVIDRLLNIIHSDKILFDEDIIFNIIKHLCTKYVSKMQRALLIPEIRQKIL